MKPFLRENIMLCQVIIIKMLIGVLSLGPPNDIWSKHAISSLKGHMGVVKHSSSGTSFERIHKPTDTNTFMDKYFYGIEQFGREKVSVCRRLEITLFRKEDISIRWKSKILLPWYWFSFFFLDLYIWSSIPKSHDEFQF